MCRDMQEKELGEARQLGRGAARVLYPVSWAIAEPVLKASWLLKGPRLHDWDSMKYAVLAGWLEAAAELDLKRHNGPR